MSEDVAHFCDFSGIYSFVMINYVKLLYNVDGTIIVVWIGSGLR